MPATLRGTAIQASSASSYTVSWPSGTVAGDLAIIFAAGGWVPSAPSGWTSITAAALSGSNWNGAIFYRVLTSGDISTGSVSVSFSGTFDAVVAIATIQGGAYYPAEADASRNSSGSTSIALSSAGSSSSGLAFYFGSNRAASSDTVSVGTSQRTANDGSAASGCLYTDTASGVLSATFNYGSAGSGNYQAIVILGAVPVVTAANLNAPMSNAGQGANHQKLKAAAPVAAVPSSGGGAFPFIG